MTLDGTTGTAACMSKTVHPVIVYQATNKVTGHRYIGVTRKGLAQRERQHRQRAERGNGFRFHLAIKKYGQENFVFEVMADFQDDEELAKAYECEAIAAYKPEYNLTEGGDGKAGPLSPESLARFRAKRAGVPSYRKGVPLSEEHKARISASNKGQIPWTKGKKMSAEQREVLRQANLGNTNSKGRVWTEEARRKVGDANRGRPSPLKGVPRTPETIAKMSAAQKGRPSIWKGVKRDYGPKVSAALTGKPWAPTEARLAALAISIEKARAARQRPIRCANDGLEFPSAIEAGAHYGLNPKLIRQQTHRGQKMRNGLKFEWVPKSR